MVLTTKTTEEIVNAVIAELINNNTDITDYNIGSIVRIIVEAISNQIGYNGDTNSLYQLVYNVYLNSRITTATEDALDELGSLVGINRNSGSKSTGYVTFKRNSDLTSNFNISSGTLVGTNPNDEGGQKQYSTLSGATFYATISGEQHKFINGIYSYPLNSRYFTTVTEVSGVSGSGVFTFAEDTDFEVSGYKDYYLDTDNSIVIIDDFETASGWSGYNCTVSLYNSGAMQGSGTLNINKTSSVSTECYVDKNISITDISNKSPHIWIRTKDLTTYNKLNKVDLYLGNSGVTNSIQYTLSRTELESSGFNEYFPQTSVVNGYPNLSAIDFTRIKVTTLNTTDTFNSGAIELDYFVFGDVLYHEGEVIKFIGSGTLPNNNTTFVTTYKPRSVDIGVEATAIGTDYNVSSNKINYKITNLPNVTNINNYLSITGGENVETDDDYRTRIQDQSSNAGKATINSIKNAILNIDGVRSVVIEDLPLKSAINEPHVYVPVVDTYKLWNEVCYLDNETTPTNITIKNSISGSGMYIYNTDYIMSGSNIIWQASGANPGSGSIFYTDYEYKHLGHAQAYVFGYTTPLSSTIVTEINETISGAVSGFKAAGIQIDWEESTPQYINVTAAITFNTGYNLSQKQEEIISSINTYITSLQVGEDVIYNEIIKAIMSVTGVYNCTLTTPSSDVVIANNRIAVLGSVTLS